MMIIILILITVPKRCLTHFNKKFHLHITVMFTKHRYMHTHTHIQRESVCVGVGGLNNQALMEHISLKEMGYSLMIKNMLDGMTPHTQNKHMGYLTKYFMNLFPV